MDEQFYDNRLNQPTVIHLTFGRELSTMKKSATMAVGFLVFALTLASVASADTFNDVDAISDDAQLTRDFKLLWNMYLLPKLENSIENRDMEVHDETTDDDNAVLTDVPSLQTAEYPRLIRRSRMKRGRGIAGLDNMDIMLKTLDRSRQRPLLSVSRMNFNKLRNLMSLQGKRRK